MQKMILTFSLVAVMTVYAVANILPLNGRTTWEIAYRLPILFTPAGYVFIIWVVIYLVLGFWIYAFGKKNTPYRCSSPNSYNPFHFYLFVQYRLGFIMALQSIHCDAQRKSNSSRSSYCSLFHLSPKRKFDMGENSNFHFFSVGFSFR